MKKYLIILLLAIFLMASCTSISVSASGTDTSITVQVISDGNVTGYINGTAVNGSVSYYIDGIEVASEFSKVRGALHHAQDTADSASWMAHVAWTLTQVNNESIALIRTDVGNNTGKIYWLRDELFGLEYDYIAFKEDTTTNITEIKLVLDDHEQRLQSNEENITALKQQVADLNATLGNIGKGLAGLGIIACGLFLANKRYPLGEVVKNGKLMFRNDGRQYKIVDFVSKSKAKSKTSKKVKAKKPRAPWLPRIKRNPDKSPLKLIKQAIRTPEKSPFRFLFSFFHINNKF